MVCTFLSNLVKNNQILNGQLLLRSFNQTVSVVLRTDLTIRAKMKLIYIRHMPVVQWDLHNRCEDSPDKIPAFMVYHLHKRCGNR